jgi:hypothetical protein
VKDNTHLLVLLDGQSVVKSLRQKISADQLPRKKLRTSCPIESAVLRKIVADKNISLKTSWKKGHAGITGNELADSAANATSSALQLGIIQQAHFQTLITDSINITPMFLKGDTVNCAFLKLIRKCVNQKSTEKIKKIVRQVHGVNCKEEALHVGLNPPKSLNKLRHYRFKLRIAAGYLPTPEFNAKRQRQNIPDKCNNCDLHIIADQDHAINNCAFTDKFSIEVLAKNKQKMNSAVHSLLAAGIICAKNGFYIPKMTKGAASSISSGISKAFLKKIWQPYAALPANIAPEPSLPPILGPRRIIACLLCSSLSNCACRHSAVECHF